MFARLCGVLTVCDRPHRNAASAPSEQAYSALFSCSHACKGRAYIHAPKRHGSSADLSSKHGAQTRANSALCRLPSAPTTAYSSYSQPAPCSSSSVVSPARSSPGRIDHGTMTVSGCLIARNTRLTRGIPRSYLQCPADRPEAQTGQC